MVKLNFYWKKKLGRFESGEALYLNRLRIAGYTYNLRTQGSDDPNSWAGNIDLPSLKDNAKRIYAPSEKEIKKKIETIITGWFEEALK